MRISMLKRILLSISLFVSIFLVLFFAGTILWGSGLNPTYQPVGDILYGYWYVGESTVIDPSNTINIITDKLGTQTRIGIIVKNNSQTIILNTVNDSDVELGLPWITKIPQYKWSPSMLLLLLAIIIIGIIGAILSAKYYPKNKRDVN